ncbi:MAG: response regulator [Desulfobacterales bacterium]|jgi:DNA-binding response OmpR family regulator
MKPYNLLIVDDEERFANMLAKRLTLRGYQCEVCYNGQQALDLVGRKEFFLILLDLHLPDIYGTEVLRRIREIHSTTPVIIVTGHGTEKDRKACMRLGAYDFVHKPLGIEALMRILEELRETLP